MLDMGLLWIYPMVRNNCSLGLLKHSLLSHHASKLCLLPSNDIISTFMDSPSSRISLKIHDKYSSGVKYSCVQALSARWSSPAPKIFSRVSASVTSPRSLKSWALARVNSILCTWGGSRVRHTATRFKRKELPFLETTRMQSTPQWPHALFPSTLDSR